MTGALARAVAEGARAAAAWVGRQDPLSADGAAVQALRAALAHVPMRGTVVIGEGARDQAPELPPGERVGRWHPEDPVRDVAVDPVECTRACAEGRGGAMCALAVGAPGSLFAAADVRMDKRAVGAAGFGCVDFDRPLAADLTALASALGVPVQQLRVAVLDRPRNAEHLAVLQEAGIRPVLVRDGDVEPALWLGEHLDLLVGSGGAPEGVLAGIGLACLGGQLVGRLLDGSDRRWRSAAGPHEALVLAGITSGALLEAPDPRGVDVRTYTMQAVWRGRIASPADPG